VTLTKKVKTDKNIRNYQQPFMHEHLRFSIQVRQLRGAASSSFNDILRWLYTPS